MARNIRPCRYTVKPMEQTPAVFTDATLLEWFLAQAQAQLLTTLLAHADDGVIWGQVQAGQLALSGKAFPEISPSLRVKTLQQARLFGPEAEVLLWHDGEGVWHARLIQDEAGESDQQWRFDEPQIQWGDHVDAARDGFTLVADGQQGLRHAVPLADIQRCFDQPADQHPDRWHPLRLGVRHYLARDDDGALVIVQSRLTGLNAVPRKEVNHG